MKITSIVFEKKVTKEEKDSLGQYSNETLRLEGTIGQDDNRDLAILNLMELVHAHLGVDFKSPIKDAVKASMANKPIDKEVKKDVKSTGKQSKQAAGDTKKEKTEAVKTETKTETKKEEVKAETGGNTKANDGESVQTSKEETKVEAAEETTEKKSKGTPYDRASVEHKTDYARIMDKQYADWRKDPAMKKHVKMISMAMEGKNLYTGAGNISKVFVNEVKEMVSAL